MLGCRDVKYPREDELLNFCDIDAIWAFRWLYTWMVKYYRSPLAIPADK